MAFNGSDMENFNAPDNKQTDFAGGAGGVRHERDSGRRRGRSSVAPGMATSGKHDPNAMASAPAASRHLRFLIAGVALIAIILAIIPWYSMHLQEKSLRQAEQGYQVDALHTAESAASWNPLSINALFVLAGAQQRIGYSTDSRQTLQKAVQMQPFNYATWEQLALYERDYWQQPGEAKKDFNRAVSLNPYDGPLRQAAGASPVAAGSGS